MREEETKPRKRHNPEDEIAAAQTNSRPFWSGTISFGLVSIPVNLFPATRDNRVALKTPGQDGHPLKRDYYSPESGEDLAEEELEPLEHEKSRDINLRLFVARSEVSPLYFERGYVLTPADKSGKAYRLLAKIMELSQRVGVATVVMQGREYLVAILASGGILRAETMRFSDEVHKPSEVMVLKRKRPSSAAVEKFHTAIDRLSRNTLDLDEMRDKYAERLLKFIQKKRSKQQIVGPQKGPAEIVDLGEVLKRNLNQRQEPSE